MPAIGPILERVYETLKADATLSQMVNGAGGAFRLGDIGEIEPTLPLVCVTAAPTRISPMFVPMDLPPWIPPDELITYVVHAIAAAPPAGSRPGVEGAHELGEAIIGSLGRNRTLLPLPGAGGEPLCIDIETDMMERFVRRRESPKEAVTVMCHVTCHDVS